MANNDYDQYFTNLYDEHFKVVVKYLLRVVHDFSQAEDLAHDLFFKFYEKRIRIEGDSRRVLNYILKSAKNRALDHIRLENRRQEKYSRHIGEIAVVDDAFMAELENSYICGEIISTVKDVLLDFPERTRRIFMDIVEGKKLVDVSDELSMTRYMTKKDYQKVCRVMRERLSVYHD
ncbi:MAG TPA: sigma-70 family RNA polymerase sigma factor [Spirochaetota bacterium]|nr:sigma-70 family RNA polymerase sigma factor [Spirochaetota bacterium]HQO40734.1 sigma-70 family RNA polymerase sigma factor [Spirochaetota bacterium]